MTTETTCLSSIWRTDDEIKDFYEIHKRPEDYKELNPGEVAYYDGMIEIDLSDIRPMIAMPFHPSNTYTCLLYTSYEHKHRPGADNGYFREHDSRSFWRNRR